MRILNKTTKIASNVMLFIQILQIFPQILILLDPKFWFWTRLIRPETIAEEIDAVGFDAKVEKNIPNKCLSFCNNILNILKKIRTKTFKIYYEVQPFRPNSFLFFLRPEF